MPSEPRLTAEELAGKWHVSRAFIYKLLKDGLPSVTIGRARRFDGEACEIWLATRQEVSA